MRKTLAVSFDEARGFHVDMPTYVMIPGTFAPVTDGLIGPDGPISGAKVADVLALGPSVEVDLPDDTPIKAGKIDAAGLRKMYADTPRFAGAAYRVPNEK